MFDEATRRIRRVRHIARLLTSARPPSPAVRLVRRVQGRSYVHVFHIKKTGGTAMRHALLSHRITPKYVVILRFHDGVLASVPKGDKIVFTVRDPLDRFVSGFYSRQRQGQPKYFLPWSPDERIAFEKFETPEQLALALSSDDADLRACAEHSMRTIGHVRSSYWDWFGDEAQVRDRWSDVLMVAHTKTLSADFETLKDLLGLDKGIGLPEDDVQAHRTPSNLDKRLSPTATDNLRAWYAGEYRFLELCRELDVARRQAVS